MEVTERLNILYESSLKEQFYKAEFDTFQNLISGYGLRGMMKHMSKSGNWFYAFEAPSKAYFLPHKKREEFSKAAEVLLRIFGKLTNAYYRDESLKKILHVNGRVRNYLGVNPGYSGMLPVARLDTLYNFKNDSLHFLEINTDIPAGIGDNDMLIKIFDCLPGMKFLGSKFEIRRDLLADPLYKMILKKYKEYCAVFSKPEKENPVLAIVCARNSDIRLEVVFLLELLREKGVNAVYADPRDFVYDGKTLVLNGEEIDIVNRRENIRDIFRTDSIGKPHSNLRNNLLGFSRSLCMKSPLMNRYLKKGYFGHTEDLLKAYGDNNVCMVNPFYSGISVQKRAFALLSDNSCRFLFDEEELQIINKHIPWTRILKKDKTFYENREINLLPFIKANKEKFVLKPNLGFGGKGVLIGSEMSRAAWERKINLITGSGLKYIVQEFIEIPSEKFPVYEKGKLKGFSPQYVNLNFWGMDGKFVGALVRASDKKVINVAGGARFVPVYYVLN